MNQHMKPSISSLPFRLTLAFITLFTVSTAHLQAQDNAVVRLTRYEVKAEQQAAFRTSATAYIRHTQHASGNILSEGYYEQDTPTVLWLIERWSNKQDLDNAAKSAPFKDLETLSQKALAKPAKVIYAKDLEPLSKQQWRAVAKKEDQPLVIMLFVDSKPGTEGDFKKVYHTAMPQFRSEPGVINYQLSQLEGDGTQFVTYEKFRNEDAFQYHLKFPPIQPVIDYLHTSIKQQPFQSGLHRLIGFATPDHQ
jgi:quinol monooxygenase YgiN